jgi:ribonuclease R
LDDFYVEGLVHVTSLPSDYYHYEAEKHRLKGERTGTTYRLGDGLTVQVARVDMDDRKIDFGLGDEKPRPRRQPRKSRGGEGASAAPAKSEKPSTRRGPRRTRNGPRKPSPNKG